MKRTLNNSSKKYKPILNTVETFGWCLGQAFLRSTFALFVNPPEGVDQGQKMLEMKKEKFSTNAKTAATPTFCKQKIIWTNHIGDMNFLSLSEIERGLTRAI